MFAYCGNNPVNRIDPSGTIAGWAIALIVVGIVGVVSGIIAHCNMPSKEEHYARNDNNTITIPQSLDDLPEDWKTSDTDIFPDRDKGPAANAHQFSNSERTNVKFVSPDGKMEAIYQGKTLVEDPRDIGTYNYCPYEGGLGSAIGHYVKDIRPWIKWGNSEEDTTTRWERMWGLVGCY